MNLEELTSITDRVLAGEIRLADTGTDEVAAEVLAAIYLRSRRGSEAAREYLAATLFWEVVTEDRRRRPAGASARRAGEGGSVEDVLPAEADMPEEARHREEKTLRGILNILE